MKYEKDQYSESFSICSFIIAGAFIWWGISWFVNSPWGLPFWIGFIWLGIGLSILINQIYRITNRSKLRNVVKFEIEGKPNITIEELSINTGISEKDVRAIILDLKGSGQLIGKFSSKTGEMKNVSIPELVKTKVEAQVQASPQDVGKFCPSCGTPVKHAESKFCEFCGAKI